MLQSIHDKSKGILGIIIVVLIGATFALFGIGDYLTGATEKFAAKVNGEEISQSQFEQGMARQRQRLEEMFQGKVPDSPIFQERIKEQVLEQLITQRILQKMAADEGYRVADEVLANKIKSMEAFKRDGIFAMDAYQSTVQSQGMAVKEFENLFRGDLVMQQIQDAITRSSMVGQGELKLLYQIQQQNRDINYLTFNSSQFVADVNVSESEISDYLEKNQARYMHPETVSISYVELKGSDMVNDIPTDEEAVKRLYDEYVASISGKEQRKARHILINVAADADAETQKAKKVEAEELLARINSGAAFAELAKEKSQDPGSATKGGDLGWVSKGMMVPEFESALYKLKKGEVSAPVKSSFGYHLIQLDEVKSAAIASFDSKKAGLVQQHKMQLLEDKFYEKSELMATTAYENDQSLQEVADALGLTIKSTKAFSRAKGVDVALNEKVRNAAFDSAVISEGRNSEIIEISKNHALVLRVDVHTEAKPKALDSVKAEITSAIKLDKAKQNSQAAALMALAKLEKGESIESKAVKASAELVKLGSVKRDNSTGDQRIIREAFSMPKPSDAKASYKVVELQTGSAVVELKAVTLPEKASAEQLQTLSRQLENEQANRDMGAVLGYLKSQSEIVRSKEL